MANTKESKMKKAFEKAEHGAEEVGRGIKKGATGVERVIKKEFGRKTAKQGQQ